jgi:hypothetical protein
MKKQLKGRLTELVLVLASLSALALTLGAGRRW